MNLIRHITTKKHLKRIYELGFLMPKGDGISVAPEEDFIAFESYSSSKAFYKAIYNGKKGKHPGLKINELVGIILDKNILIEEGYQIVDSISPDELTRIEINGQKFTTKWENETMLHCNILEQDEFNNIGEYVFVKGNIPTNLIVHIESMC